MKLSKLHTGIEKIRPNTFWQVLKKSAIPHAIIVDRGHHDRRTAKQSAGSNQD